MEGPDQVGGGDDSDLLPVVLEGIQVGAFFGRGLRDRGKSGPPRRGDQDLVVYGELGDENSAVDGVASGVLVCSGLGVSFRDEGSDGGGERDHDGFLVRRMSFYKKTLDIWFIVAS